MKNTITIFEGDNLKTAMKLNKSNTKVDIVYIDPPYNTKGKNTSHLDTFLSDEKNDLISQESLGWMYFMKPRLEQAHKLLSEDGFIAVSIGHEEIGSLKLLLDKIFGRGNEIAITPRITNLVSKTTNTISKNHDFLVFYKKSNRTKLIGTNINTQEYKLADKYLSERGMYFLRRLDYKDFRYQRSLDFEIEFEGNNYFSGPSWEGREARKNGSNKYKDWCFIWSKERTESAIENGFIEAKNGNLFKKTYVKALLNRKNEVELGERMKPYGSLDFLMYDYSNSRGTKELKESIGENEFSFPKPSKLIEDIINMSPKDNPLILDMFAGAGTTGIASVKTGASCILMQNSEEIRTSNNPDEFTKIINITIKNIRTEIKKNGTSTKLVIKRKKTN